MEDDGRKCMTCKNFYHVFDDYGACVIANEKHDTSMVRFDTKACAAYVKRGVGNPWDTTELKN